MARAQQLTLTALVLAAVALVQVQARLIEVGGKAQWNFGVDYQAWKKNLTTPVKLGDTLVFYFDNPPQHFMGEPVYHTVAQFPDLEHYRKCNFTGTKVYGGLYKGPKGIKVKLSKRKRYYFGCAYPQHCTLGKMHFFIKPV